MSQLNPRQLERTRLLFKAQRPDPHGAHLTDSRESHIREPKIHECMTQWNGQRNSYIPTNTTPICSDCNSNDNNKAPNDDNTEPYPCILCGNINTACEKCVRKHYINQFNCIQPDDLLPFTIPRESLASEYDTKNDSIRMSKHVVRKGLCSTGSKVHIGVS